MALEYEPIPDRMVLSAKAWREWCEERDFDCLGNHATSRGAWIDELGTYIRGHTHLVYEYGELVDIVSEVPK